MVSDIAQIPLSVRRFQRPLSAPSAVKIRVQNSAVLSIRLYVICAQTSGTVFVEFRSFILDMWIYLLGLETG